MKNIDKLIIASIAFFGVSLIAVAAWSMATSQSLMIGFGYLEVPLQPPWQVIFFTIPFCFTTSGIIVLLLRNRSLAYLILGAVLVALGSAAVISFLASREAAGVNQQQWIDLTFLLFLAAGLISIIYGIRLRQSETRSNNR